MHEYELKENGVNAALTSNINPSKVILTNSDVSDHFKFFFKKKKLIRNKQSISLNNENKKYFEIYRIIKLDLKQIEA